MVRPGRKGRGSPRQQKNAQGPAGPAGAGRPEETAGPGRGSVGQQQQPWRSRGTGLTPRVAGRRLRPGGPGRDSGGPARREQRPVRPEPAGAPAPPARSPRNPRGPPRPAVVSPGGTSCASAQIAAAPVPPPGGPVSHGRGVPGRGGYLVQLCSCRPPLTRAPRGGPPSAPWCSSAWPRLTSATEALARPGRRQPVTGGRPRPAWFRARPARQGLGPCPSRPRPGSGSGTACRASGPSA